MSHQTYEYKLVHEIFEEQAKINPDNIAIEHNGCSVTYSQLDKKSNILARRLATKGVSRESLVGILLERSTDFIVGMLGVLKTGAAYIPIEANVPKQHLEYILGDSKAHVIVTNEPLNKKFNITKKAHTASLIKIDEINWRAESPHYQSASHLSVSSLAYVIYTSGSTGNPKGVMVEHRSILNLLNEFKKLYHLTINDVSSYWTNCGFDVSCYEILGPLLSGSQLRIIPAPYRLVPIRLFDWLADNKITSAYIPPFFLSDLCNYVSQYPKKLSLKMLLVGVEPIPKNVVLRIRSKMQGLSIINGYGPSETTVCSTLFDTQYLAVFGDGNVPIGRPIANTKCHILDQNKNLLVSENSEGELHISGIGLARGYLNRPSLTAEKFTPNPFENKIGDRIYSTGDQVRALPCSNLEFIGRLDHQVKIRGYRIELGQIESELVKLPQVNQAIVAVHQHTCDKYSKYIAAYILLTPGSEQNRSLLRSLLTRSLPAHAIPAAFVFMEHLPLNQNEKMDRNSLPPPRQDDF